MKAVRLGEHARLIRGITFKPQDKCDPHDEGAVVCMRTKNVQSTLDGSDLIAIPMSLVKNIEKMISIGDILVSSANSWNLVGKCCQVRELQFPSTAGGFISILRPKTDKLDAGYLYRWFSSEKIQNRVRSFGNQTTNISNLDHKRTLNLQIPLPPIAEQKRIAAILDAADALRTKRRETLAQLDTLLQSTFLYMFGDPVTNPMRWPAVPLRSVAELENGDRSSNYPSGSDILDSGVLFLRTKNICNNELVLSNCQFISKEKFLSLSRGRLRRKDLVITLRGTLGACAIFDCGFDTGFINAQILILHPSNRIDHRFMHAFLTTEAMNSHFEKLSTGVAVKQLTGKQIGNLSTPLPPLPLQRRFASIVESVEKQKTRLRAHLTELDTLFASLQHRAFNGEL